MTAMCPPRVVARSPCVARSAGGLAGRVVAQLERTGRIVLDAFRRKGNVRLCIRDETRRDLVGRCDAFQFTVGDQALDLRSSTFPAHWTTT